VNRRIRVPQVRVIGADGGQLGVLDTSEALRIAEEGGLDLVEVSPKAMPPVCKIMDYGKFKYEDSKKRKDAKKHQSTVTYKEIKFRPKTDAHDLDFKVKHIRRFLLEGNKARLVVIFRGREIVHPETGQAMLKKVIELTNDIAMVEQPPMMEGRRMLMIISPKAGAVAKPPGAPGATPSPSSPSSPSSSAGPSAPRPAAAPSAPRPATAPSAPRPATAPSASPAAPRPASAAPAPRPAAPQKPKPAQPAVSIKPPAK
jgi:translation initiation factor IF-3